MEGYFSTDTLKLVASEFSDISSHYFNTAYFGPLPKSAFHAVEKRNRRLTDPSFTPYEEWVSMPEKVRVEIAQLLNTKAKNILHSTSTSDVMALISQGIDLEKTDKVISLAGDYPSNVLPWKFGHQRNEINYEILENAPAIPNVEWLSKNLPENTKVFNISHVAFNSGRKVNLLGIGKYLKNRNITFIVDGTQGFGGLEISKEELALIDVFVCSTYKWLCGPYGHAFAYLSDKFLEKFRAQRGSWLNGRAFHETNNLLDYSLNCLEGARAFDRGQSPNVLNMSGLMASLKLFNQIGLNNISKHNHSLMKYFLEKLDSKNLKPVVSQKDFSNIICLKANMETSSVQRKLKEKNIDVSIRDGKIRVSFHLFNTIEQVKILLNELSII